MYSYNISKFADNNAFQKACRLIESRLSAVEKEKLLEDVDGTQIQIYDTANGEIKVVNDYEVDAVYVDSDINLDKIV